MRPKKYPVKLTEEQKEFLDNFVNTGVRSARQITRARILLLSSGGKSDNFICEALQVDSATVFRLRRSFCKEGLESALYDNPRPGQPRKFSASDEEKIVALVCSDPPEGRKRWTIELITEEVEKRKVTPIAPSREKIRLILVNHKLKPWRKKNVVCAET